MNRIVDVLDRPTPAKVGEWLTCPPGSPETEVARTLILSARYLVSDHGGQCTCGRCRRLTPIAELPLPEDASDGGGPGSERPTVVLSADVWAALTGTTDPADSPTPEVVQAWLDSDQRSPEAAWAAHLVLSAREIVTRHGRKVWARKVRESRTSLVNRAAPMCECHECASKTPFANLIVRDVDGGWAAFAAAKAARDIGSRMTIGWVPAENPRA